MTYQDMIFDAGMYLGFYGFGLASGVFLFWVETKVRRL